MIRKKHQPTKTKMASKKTEKNYVELSYPATYFFGLLLLIMIFVIGYFLGKDSRKTIPTTNTGATKQAAQPQISLDSIKALFAKDVIRFGDINSKLLMVEVADPSCPYCHIAAGVNAEIGAQAGPQFKLVSQGGTYVAPVPEMKKLVDQGKAAFAWIYTRGHGNGELATKALYCAFDQGKFWQAHDLLLSAKGYDLQNNQIKNDATKSQQLTDFLATAVDKNQLKNCLDSGKYDARLGEESALAASLGVNGTPGFFLNAINFAGAYSWNDMRSAAETALQQ